MHSLRSNDQGYGPCSHRLLHLPSMNASTASATELTLVKPGGKIVFKAGASDLFRLHPWEHANLSEDLSEVRSGNPFVIQEQSKELVLSVPVLVSTLPTFQIN